MAYVTENTYTGNGSTVLYSFTFPYLETTDIKVTVAEEARTQGSGATQWTLPNATQIQFNTAPTNGQAIRIYRDTDIDNLKAEFFAGSAIRSQDLNEDFLQNLYNSQEAEAAIDQKWEKGTSTIDSTEAFVDSNDKIMTAAAIDDRINANIAVQPLADGKILAGNGSGVAAAVTPSGDVTMANTGAFTIATGSVEHAMLAADAVDGDNIQDDVINSEHIAAGAIDLEHMSSASVDSDNIVNDTIVNADINSSAAIAHSKLANITNGQILVGNGSNVPTAVAVSGDVTLANDGAVTIANDAVEQAMIADDAVGADQLASNAVVNDSVASGAAIAHSKLASVTDGQILVGNGSNVPTAVAVSGDVTIANTGAVTIANDAIEIGMIGCEQTTISDSDSHIPTSGAVVDYVTSRISPIGGLEVIDDDESFPNTIPPAGVVVSITDAAGLQVNSSGVSTNGDALDNSTITINGFPSELRGGVGSNPDPYVFQSGAGLMVVSTGSSQTYNYHQAMIRESDFVQLSDDINDFNNRYRIGTRTANSASSNDDGDLFFDTGTNKMYVYDGAYDAGGEWKEVTSAGDYKFLTIKDHDQAVGGSGPTYGSNVEFDLFDGSADASITSAAQLIVVLNGVIQKPNAAYDGSMEGFSLNDTHGIKFATAPPSGSSMFVTQIGTATTISTPGTGSISNANMFAAGVINAAAIGTSAVETAKIDDDAVTYAKIQNVSATDRVLGRDSSGAGVIEEITPANLRTMINVEDGADVTDATNVNAAGAIMHSDLATKGQIVVGDGSGDATILAVGSNTHVLTADSSEASGVKWAAASGGAALANDGDNRVVTADGSGGLNGEANLTFDGTTLAMSNPTPTITLTDSDTTGPPVAQIDGSGGDLDLRADTGDGKSGSKVRVYIDGSEKARFHTDGGITFNGDTAVANALDDYEEGTFTVTCAHSVTLEAGQDLARYCKIGRMVFLGGQVHINSSNSNQNFIITNLPFASAPSDGESTGSQYWLASTYDLNHQADSIGIRLQCGAGTQNANLIDVRDDGGYSQVPAEDGKYVILGGVYFAAT